MTAVPTDTGWMDAAACRGATNTMFPARGDNAGLVDALATCTGCPVTRPCRELVASDDDLWSGPGVFGGLTASHRRRVGGAGRRTILAGGTVDTPTVLAPAACGTWHGYRRHRRAGEEPCQPCRDGARAADYGRRREAVA